MRKFILLTVIFMNFYFNIFSNNIKQDSIINHQNLIESLMFVESSFNTMSISKDSSCVGVLQIKKIVVDDCNEYLQMKKSDKRYTYDDRYDKEKSIEMFYLIQERYKNYKQNRSKNYIEHMIRLWNGGCAYNIKSTQEYYEKVISIYTKKQNN